MYNIVYASSPVGPLTLAADDTHITGLWMEGQKYFGATLSGPPVRKADHPVLQKACQWLDRYFAGERPGISELPLAPSGSEFRREVWRILCGIPYGEVMTYGEIGKRVAAEMGRKSMSAQAVGGAVGHNPISILIPCHRVVGSDGSLTGYAGGLVRKRRLLELEGVNLSRLFVPSVGTAL